MPLHQLFSRHATMTDKDNDDNVLEEEEEEIVINVQKLMDDNIETIYGKEMALSNIAKERSINTSKTTESSKHCDTRNQSRHKTTKNNCFNR